MNSKPKSLKEHHQDSRLKQFNKKLLAFPNTTLDLLDKVNKLPHLKDQDLQM